jgi:hypothetical protein
LKYLIFSQKDEINFATSISIQSVLEGYKDIAIPVVGDPTRGLVETDTHWHLEYWWSRIHLSYSGKINTQG